MKTIINILTIIAILILCTFRVKAQNLKYKSIVTDHFKNGAKTTSTTKFKPGLISIKGSVMLIDTETFTIIKHEAIETGDEGYFQQPVLVVTQTKKGAYKVLECVLLLNHNKTIAEVIIKKSKSSNVSYILD